jgi:hypothetical protein
LRAFLLGQNVNRSFCGFPVYSFFDGSRIDNPKFMEDKEMESELSDRDAEIEQLKSRLAELLGEKILAEGDAQGGITFAMIESMAHEAGKQMACESAQRAVQRHGERFEGQAECPGCGAWCPVGGRSRKVLAVDGRMEYVEPVAHCPACRRDFFPSADGVAVGFQSV